MKKLFVLLFCIFAAVSVSMAQEDKEGSKDPALFTRMPKHHISRYEDKQFDSFTFWVSSEKKETVEGHCLSIQYYLDEGAQDVSGLQVVRNYTNAVKKIGGQLVYQYDDGGYQIVILKVKKDGKETWAQVTSAGNGYYTVDLVEKQAMEQDVVADAASMASSINETGRVALYGIYFDSGKSALKAESTAALQEIAKLLKSDPSLKIYVVGHTDNTGTYDANMKLSVDRALSVVNELVTKYGVPPAVLKACGAGPISPVATNSTDAGKALNRRVELVKQ
jgi:OmpA-OmpF porin, OOP family